MASGAPGTSSDRRSHQSQSLAGHETSHNVNLRLLTGDIKVTGTSFRPDATSGEADMNQPVKLNMKASAKVVQLQVDRSATNIPAATFELIGRAAAVLHLEELLSAYRVVTLTGPGGIGKTTLALEVARTLAPNFRDGRFLIELASVSNPALVASTVAGAIGIKPDGQEISADFVARTIGKREFLLVLDNCEHVVEAAAELTEALMNH